MGTFCLPLRAAGSRERISRVGAACAAALLILCSLPGSGLAAEPSPRVKKAITDGLEYLVHNQHRTGEWHAKGRPYPVAMTSLAGIAFLAEGSTTTQGRYAETVRRAVDFVTSQSRANGLIGDPLRDDRYTYGHGFALLFLSQVLGEEEDAERRDMLLTILAKGVQFTGAAQMPSGGWGYVTAKDANGFDEGSTTITQVQALRACRNAGIPVPKEPIDKALAFIKTCVTPDGGIMYRPGMPGTRPPITGAAVACLFNAGAYDSELAPKLLGFCRKSRELQPSAPHGAHWHYAHYYWSQVLYREGGKEWDTYREGIERRLLADQDQNDGSWKESHVGPVYGTAVNLTILQLEKATLPIYQR